jgi:ribonuclease D
MSHHPSGHTPSLIATTEAFHTCIEALRHVPSLAFDLEFDANLRRYGVTLGLIQIALPDDRSFLIDPLVKELDLALLWRLFEDPSIQKLVHSPGEDLRLLHSLGCFPQNVYDTEITARLLDYEHTSLTRMLEGKLNVTISGGQQRSNWLQRPLTHEQIIYAAADALHLHALKRILDEEAAARGLTAFVEDEQAALARARYDKAPRTTFLKPLDERNFSPHQQHILQALLSQRDAWAREANRPLFKVADDSALRAMVEAGRTPRTENAKAALVAPYNSDDYAGVLVETYETAAREADARRLSHGAAQRPRMTREQRQAREQGARDRTEKFPPVQAALAQEYGTFAARYLLSNTTVESITKGETSLTRMDRPYRRRVILEKAAALGIDLSLYD